MTSDTKRRTAQAESTEEERVTAGSPAAGADGAAEADEAAVAAPSGADEPIELTELVGAAQPDTPDPILSLYRGIRGAESAARLRRAAIEGRCQPQVLRPVSAASAEEILDGQALSDESPAPEESRPAPSTAQTLGNIFAAADAMAKNGTGAAGLPAKDAGMPALPGQPGKSRQPMPLEQARAQAYAQHVPTRRPLTPPGPQAPGMPPATGGQMFQSPPDPAVTRSNLRGFFSFLFSLVHKGENEQKPDRSLGSLISDLLLGRSPARTGARSTTMQNLGLFAALDAPLQGLTPEDIQYAGDVDAAYSRRPRVGIRFIFITTVTFFGILLLWAGFSRIDEVTHSEGSVVGSQSTQTISNLEGGILRSMLVRDGSTVQKGDVIAQIDNEMAASSYRDAMQRSMDNVFALIRLEAELAGKEPVFPKDLYAWATDYFHNTPDASMMQQAQQIVHDQTSLWTSRKKRFLVDREVLSNQVIQRDREVQEQITHREQLVQSLDLARQQRDAAAQLVRRNNFSRLEFLNMESRVVELQGQVDMLAASISRAQAAAAEARHRIESHEAEFRNSITEEINKRRVELTTLQETLSAGGDRVTRTDVRSPVRGIVKQIYINTIGGVIKPGEPILDIVPLDDTLLVEARVRPQDVAFLRPGQDVMIKVTAYDFSIYGGLEGKLEQISADTIEGKQGEFYYLVKIRTSRTYLEHNNETLPIIPGMIVQADILTGKKTILQYLMKPILKAKQNALTER